MNRASLFPNATQTMMKAATLSLALTFLLAAALACNAQIQPQETAVNEAVYRYLGWPIYHHNGTPELSAVSFKRP